MAKFEGVTNCWPQIISYIVNLPAKNSIWSVIQRLVWGATIYYVWQERNIRLFGGNSRTEDVLFKIITKAVRFRIMGLQLKVTPDVINASKVWNFPISKSFTFKGILDELLSDVRNYNDNNV